MFTSIVYPFRGITEQEKKKKFTREGIFVVGKPDLSTLKILENLGFYSNVKSTTLCIYKLLFTILRVCIPCSKLWSKDLLLKIFSQRELCSHLRERKKSFKMFKSLHAVFVLFLLFYSMYFFFKKPYFVWGLGRLTYSFEVSNLVKKSEQR